MTLDDAYDAANDRAGRWKERYDALRAMLADVWDEGWDAGRSISELACPDDHNPYRDQS